MAPLSRVQAFARRRYRYGAAVRILLSVLLVLVFVPGWSGDARLDLYAQPARMTATRVMLDPDDPAVTKAGRLTFLGGVALHSDDPAFGGFSSLAIDDGDRFTLLSDGGNYARFRMGGDWRLRDVGFGALPAGPGTGWEKADRDSESMAVDPATRQMWVGFEKYNQVWRYSAGFARAERSVVPAAMAKWDESGGAETMVRRRDGRFVVISETSHWPRMPGRAALVFAGDPTEHAHAIRFVYRPPPHTNPSDAAELPDGSLIVINRRFRLPYRFSVVLTIVPAGVIAAGRIVDGTPIATLAPPLIHDNFEGVTATRENGATILWLVSDDNQSRLQRSLLLKFRLD